MEIVFTTSLQSHIHLFSWHYPISFHILSFGAASLNSRNRRISYTMATCHSFHVTEDEDSSLHVHAYLYVCMCLCVCVCARARARVCVLVCLCVRARACMQVCMYVSMHKKSLLFAPQKPFRAQPKVTELSGTAWSKAFLAKMCLWKKILWWMIQYWSQYQTETWVISDYISVLKSSSSNFRFEADYS
jgi:hypothetical protein